MKHPSAITKRQASTLTWLAATSWACGNLLGADELRFDPKLSSGGSSGAAIASSPGGKFSVPEGSGPSGGDGAINVFGGAQNAGGTPNVGGAPNPGNDDEGGANTGTGADEGEPSNGGAGGTPSTRGEGGAAGLAGSPADSEAGTSGDPQSIPLIPVPPTYGYYCSVQNGTAWALAMGTEPCTELLSNTSWGPDSVRRAGLYDRGGRNNVFVRCDGASNLFWTNGELPLTKAYNWATSNSRKSCVFTAAPQRLPIFKSPFVLDRLPAGFELTNRVFDFATVPGAPGAAELPEATLDVRDYSQTALDPSRCVDPSPGCAPIVSYRGEDRSEFPEGNDSQGFDWRMAVGTPIQAMASGQVIARRTRPAKGCTGGEESELYIKHIVADQPSSPYAEIFVVYYSHLTFAPETEVGKAVQAGQVVGSVSAAGCTGGVGLFHLSVIRLSNTATEYQPILDTTIGVYGLDGRAPDNSVSRVDPYGWMASSVLPPMDPGGYHWINWRIPFMGPAGAARIGGGAWSIALWREGQAPPRPCDRDDHEWPAASGTLKNPHAHCER